MRKPGADTRRSPLVFGIYPGGAAGTVGPAGKVKPEDPARRMAALKRLRAAGHPFVVRLYAAYSGSGSPSAAEQLGQQIASYAQAGFDIEVVLTYRPRDGGSAAAVAGFAKFTRNAVRTIGASPRFVSVQITNEANIAGVPNVADGYYADAKNALVRGVVDAKHEALSRHLDRLKIGFNWAYVNGGGDREFWSYLGRHGGSSFVKALDWVGVDVYPGTWGPPLRAGNLRSDSGAFVDKALRSLHSELLAVARIPRSIAIHISENGYPTGPGRTGSMQVDSMRGAIAAIWAARRMYNITSYCWFDLRDADSSSQTFEAQYGLLRDDYSPKPAFEVYRHFVSARSR